MTLTNIGVHWHIFNINPGRSVSNMCRNVGTYSYLSSAPFGKPIQRKCRDIFLPLLDPIRKAYPTQSSGDILTSSRPHSASLPNTNVGRYSCLSLAPFGKPIQHKSRDIFLPLLGPIWKACLTQMSGNILASPRFHLENFSSTNVTLTCYVIMWQLIYKIFQFSNSCLRQNCSRIM
jgi:hypothetical protein